MHAIDSETRFAWETFLANAAYVYSCGYYAEVRFGPYTEEFTLINTYPTRDRIMIPGYRFGPGVIEEFVQTGPEP